MNLVFQKESEFSQMLKQRVREHLYEDKNGRAADFKVWAKAVLLLLVCAMLYLSILFAQCTLLMRTGLVISFSVATLLLGLNVMHEAAHGNYSIKPWINRTLALVFDLFGISSDLYMIKHTQFHHNYTNIYGHDGDISETPLIRMSTQQTWMPIHRLQVYYTPLLYSLITITWTFSDISRLISGKVGTYSFRRPDRVTVARILFFKMISIYLTYILPIQILGLSQAIFFILLFHLAVGVILALIFQVAHVHQQGKYDYSEAQSDWFIHQLQTSADFSTNSPVANWLCGGLNLQVIHHLFPNVSYRHYPAIRKIVKELCVQHGIRYIEFPTLASAVVAHFTWLQQLAKR